MQVAHPGRQDSGAGEVRREVERTEVSAPGCRHLPLQRRRQARHGCRDDHDGETLDPLLSCVPPCASIRGCTIAHQMWRRTPSHHCCPGCGLGVLLPATAEERMFILARWCPCKPRVLDGSWAQAVALTSCTRCRPQLLPSWPSDTDIHKVQFLCCCPRDHDEHCHVWGQVNTPYGSAVYSDSTGVLLNNEMADFSTPGQHDVFDLPPAESNFIRCAIVPLPLPPSPNCMLGYLAGWVCGDRVLQVSAATI